MFKKFIPKEDIATSTSIKSSIQRQIRSKLLAQIPLLSAPAHPAVVEPAGEGSDDESEEEERVVSTRKKGAKKEEKEKEKEKNKGGKGGKGRKEVVVEVEEDEGEGEEDVLTLLDVLWPKKEGLTLVKCREHVSILALHGEPLFFQHFDGPYYPTLKILHKYPTMLPHVSVDRGAIKFVLAGANIMCPGLTSPTASLPSTNVPAGTPVAVHASGKELALGIGLTSMSTEDMKKLNKGIGVENICYLGDDLWAVGRL